MAPARPPLPPFDQLPAPARPLLAAGDNLAFMQALLDHGQAGSIDLIYLDPPFLTGDRFGMASRNGVAALYDDAWPSLDAYLQFLRLRLQAMRRLLADHGALFLHCDWRTSAHLRLLLEELFGAENFRNEIIWRRGDNRGRKSCARHLGRTVDSILYFVKNAQTSDLRFTPPIHARRHRLRAGGRPPAGFHRDADGRYFKTAPRGDYTDQSIARLRAENRIYETRTGRLRVKYFLDTDGDWLLEPIPLDTLWTDLPDAMHLPARERFGYPTQKPLVLLERIVICASRPGDRVLDPFCGSGTTLVAAARQQRTFVGCDRSPAAVNLSAARLILAGAADFDRLGADPIAGDCSPAACGLAVTRTTGGGLRLRPRPAAPALSAADSAKIMPLPRANRGVRLRRNPAPAGGPPNSAAVIAEGPLVLECRLSPAPGVSCLGDGTCLLRRLPLPLPPVGIDLENALAAGAPAEYDLFVIDGLGQRFRLVLEVPPPPA